MSASVQGPSGHRAETCLAAGIRPDAVIGDLDSISAEARSVFAEVLHPVTEQVTTDFEKCLMRIEAPLVLAVGFTGGRVDHLLAVLNVLARYADRRIVLLGTDDVSVIVPDSMTMALAAGERISLLPLSETICSTTGLRWDLTDAALAPHAAISISNAAAAPTQCISATGLLLCSVPRRNLNALLAAL